MAQITKVVLTCDVDGDGTEAQETIRFGFDGRDYEIELCSRHHEELAALMLPYVDKARRADSAPGRRRRGARSSSTGAASSAVSTATSKASGSPARRASAQRREDLQPVRTWAREHGMRVSDRGRISQEVTDAYAAAHG